MTIFQTILISIVEGITEFLPISSTGHMIITQKLLGVESTEFVKAFTVNIQFGAILSVVVLYWKRFFQTFDFYLKLFVAFIPAAILGFLLGKQIDKLLENVAVVAVTLLLGGIVLLFVDKWFSKPDSDQNVSSKKALFIGFFQCIALIPGVSRSAATIIGGMSNKLTRKNAAEFSFFLAVPTMFAASAYKLLGSYKTLLVKSNLDELIIGNVVSFIVAMIAIRWLMKFLTHYGFRAFGWYRIILGTIILGMLALGYDLKIA
ncbi:MAG: undecaprenyl-diphosphate phosphatase [Bacteroidota bacterium]|nr:undecaprenyl-diphosphate phosphatase [Bacteroidota bacterium]MDP4205448.1 undecaprenyl-diphosphate phosphatase [Bacteroidota bacterium]